VASFDIDPAFAAQLEWIRTFVAEEVEPLDLAFGGEEVIKLYKQGLRDEYRKAMA
jgi:acyl-CoA dehydrogenase